MLVGLVVAAIAVILLAGFGTSVFRAWRRRQRDELRSIGSYHDRLDSLHVAGTDRGGSVRLVAEDASAPPARAQPERPRLRPWAAPLGRAPDPESAEHAARHGRTWALGRSQPRHRVDTTTALVVVVTIVVVGALAVVGVVLEHRHDAPPPTHRHAVAYVAAEPAVGAAAPVRPSTYAYTIARSRHAS